MAVVLVHAQRQGDSGFLLWSQAGALRTALSHVLTEALA